MRARASRKPPTARLNPAVGPHPPVARDTAKLRDSWGSLTRLASTSAALYSLRMRFLSLLALLPFLGGAQIGPTNLDFEVGVAGAVPQGWFVPTSDYSVELRREGCFHGSGCAVIQTKNGTPSQPFGNLMQVFPAQPYRGKNVRLRAAIRVDQQDGGGHCQMWLRVDRADGQMGFFDNMGDRPVTAINWQFYEISGEVESDARSINIGFILVGKARVWADDVTFEVVPETPPKADDDALKSELQRVYGRMDAAEEGGRLDEFASLVMPDAVFVSGANRASLSSVLAEMNELYAAGTRFHSKTTVKSISLTGDRAVVTTEQQIGQDTTNGRQDFISRGQDTWVRTSDGWRLAQNNVTSVRAVVPPFDPATLRPIIAELTKAAVPLKTVEAGNPTDDLAAFGNAVGDARFVALGEASHGTREFFQMKHRLLEYLVKEKGFTVFAIEGNWPEALAIDRYIKKGDGDAAAGLAAMYFWTWQTEEVRDLVEWMRRYNQAPGQHPILTFTSFDMQTSKVAGERAVDYLKRNAPGEAAAAAAVYERANAIANSMSDPKAKEIAEAANDVVKVFDTNRGEMEKSSSQEEWRNARQAAAVAYQAVFLRSAGAGGGYRDEMMAANIEWLAREVYPKEKIVIWAHNAHVAFGAVGHKSMGTWLRAELGRQYYVLGFAWRRGEVRAVGYSNGKPSGLGIYPAAPAPANSGSAVLGMAAKPLYFLNLAGLPAESPLRRWLEQDHLFYDFGAVWQVADPEANLSPESLAKRYDGLIFIDETHAARALPIRR